VKASFWIDGQAKLNFNKLFSMVMIFMELTYFSQAITNNGRIGNTP
jgi:hypothetical protein